MIFIVLYLYKRVFDPYHECRESDRTQLNVHVVHFIVFYYVKACLFYIYNNFGQNNKKICINPKHNLSFVYIYIF